MSFIDLMECTTGVEFLDFSGGCGVGGFIVLILWVVSMSGK